MRTWLLIAGMVITVAAVKGQSRFIGRIKEGQNLDVKALNVRLNNTAKLWDSISVTTFLSNQNAGPRFVLLYVSAGDTTSLVASGLFEYIEPDHIGYAAGGGQQNQAPNDPGFPLQWYLHNDGTFTQGNPKPGADIQMLEAWEITQGDSAVLVAILDSGINSDHLEFRGRLWRNAREVAGDNKDNDNNGFMDDSRMGWDFINSDNDPRDDNGHGTAVTGIMAANTHNAFRFAGIDQHCKLMICKVLDKNLTGYYSQWIAGLYYAVDQGARIINFSLGGKQPSRALQEAIEYAESKGVLVVAAMQNYNTVEPYYPAAYTQTVSVGATDPDDNRSTAFNNSSTFGSNYGDHIDLVAPGNFIYGLGNATEGDPGKLWFGTSMAAPIVSGIASLLIAQDRSRHAGELKAILFATAEDLIGHPSEDTPGWDQYYGYGRVNAFYALSGTGRTALTENKPYLFPNPSPGDVNLYLMQPAVASLKITVCDTQGRVVMELVEDSGERVVRKKLDLNFLPAGIYLVRIQTPYQSVTQRFSIF